MKMKVVTEYQNADESMIGKPVRAGEKVIGKITDIGKNTIISEVEDEFYTKLFENMPTSMGVKDE